MIYLASPYSHSNPSKRQERFNLVCKASARLIEKGNLVFSPIAHSHHIAKELSNNAIGFEYWKEFDLKMIAFCDVVFVLCLQGWKESKGVQSEIEFAGVKNIPVKYFVFDVVNGLIECSSKGE